MEKIKTTLGDPPARMVWRTKQNLDYAYAMLHVYNSKPSSKYYVQLEDDIITVPGKCFCFYFDKKLFKQVFAN